MIGLDFTLNLVFLLFEPEASGFTSLCAACKVFNRDVHLP